LTIFINIMLIKHIIIDQVNNDILSVVGKGNKERKISLTPAAKKSINNWLHIRNSMNITSNSLFISRNNNRLTTRAIQNIVKKYIISSGLNPKSISTHKLRHTAATLMYKYGRVDIRVLLKLKYIPIVMSINYNLQ